MHWQMTEINRWSLKWVLSFTGKVIYECLFSWFGFFVIGSHFKITPLVSYLLKTRWRCVTWNPETFKQLLYILQQKYYPFSFNSFRFWKFEWPKIYTNYCACIISCFYRRQCYETWRWYFDFRFLTSRILEWHAYTVLPRKHRNIHL